MNLTYDSNLITITALATNGQYSIVNDDVGLKRLTSFTKTTLGLDYIAANLTNPKYSVQYALSAVLYFVEGGVEYQI
jgi:hypothetical protein